MSAIFRAKKVSTQKKTKRVDPTKAPKKRYAAGEEKKLLNSFLAIETISYIYDSKLTSEKTVSRSLLSGFKLLMFTPSSTNLLTILGPLDSSVSI